ncbi:MAG: hypothetical protein R3F34_08320 [Planctomycetota bacterium]
MRRTRRAGRAVQAERAPVDLAAEAELFDRVAAEVERFEDPFRHVLLLRLLHGLTPTQIAHATGSAP